jgi:hypothetical protein
VVGGAVHLHESCSAMSASRIRATPSGMLSRAATSATDRTSAHSVGDRLVLRVHGGPLASSVLDTSASIARSNDERVRPPVRL